MSDTATHWVCCQDLGPYPSLDSAEPNAELPTVRFTRDTARIFAEHTARLALHTDHDTPVLSEDDNGFITSDGGTEPTRAHIDADGRRDDRRPLAVDGLHR